MHYFLSLPNFSSPLPSNGVDLIDEYDAGRLLLGLRKEVSHALGPHAHKHLFELRAGAVEKGHFCLPGDGARQKSLSGSGSTGKQDLRHNMYMCVYIRIYILCS